MRTRTFLKIHFGLLAFLVLHFCLQSTYRFGLNTSLIFIMKLLFYGSGVILFFSFFPKWKILKYYAGLFVFMPAAVFIGWLIDGILGAILGSFLLLFFYVPATVVSEGEFTVKAEYAGLMNACCYYGLYQTKFGLFERPITRFKLNAPENAIQRVRVNPARTFAMVYYTSEQNTSAMETIKLPQN